MYRALNEDHLELFFLGSGFAAAKEGLTMKPQIDSIVDITIIPYSASNLNIPKFFKIIQILILKIGQYFEFVSRKKRIVFPKSFNLFKKDCL